MPNTAAAFTVQDPCTAASSRNLVTGPASSNPPQEALPSIIVLVLFQYLDFRSLLKCRLVYSGFRSLIDSTASLQYQIELSVAGQQDGSYGDLFTRREMLKLHQKRWDGLHWSKVLRVPMMSTFWRLYGGVFAQYGEVLSQASALHLKRLPSQSRGIEEKNWVLDLTTLFGEETSMGNFGMDPSQDLLVVVARTRARTGKDTRIHLLTLSNGERHRLTSEPCVVPDDLVSDGRLKLFYIEILHDFLSIRFIGGTVIWNWKTGQVLMHVIDSDIASVVFLNERYVLMVAKDENSRPYLLAVDFLAGTSEPRPIDELENCFIFWFPDISGKSPIHNVTIRSNPRSTWDVDTDLLVPFSMIPQNRLFVVYLTCDNIDEDLCFAILEASFLSLIKTGLRVNNNSFDWPMWGPEHSRTLYWHNEFSEYLPSLPSHGTRLVMKRCLPDNPGQGTLVDVYDFNQLRCRRKKQDSNVDTPKNVTVSESSAVCVSAPTRIKVNVFRDQVETRLEYTVTSRFVSERIRSGSVMCSEDAVITVDNACKMYKIYTV